MTSIVERNERIEFSNLSQSREKRRSSQSQVDRGGKASLIFAFNIPGSTARSISNLCLPIYLDMYFLHEAFISPMKWEEEEALAVNAKQNKPIRPCLSILSAFSSSSKSKTLIPTNGSILNSFPLSTMETAKLPLISSARAPPVTRRERTNSMAGPILTNRSTLTFNTSSDQLPSSAMRRLTAHIRVVR